MYNTKYIAYFKSKSNASYVIRLKKLNYVGVTSEVRVSDNPLVLTYPSAQKYDPVRGAGLVINLISSFDRQLIDMYTANYKEWKVEIEKNGGVFFLGYVEPEMYSEPFSKLKNYEVSITCNNGIGVLSRDVYVAPDNSRYSGITTVFDAVSNIVSKIGIEYSSLNLITDLKVNNITPATNKSVLQLLTVNNDNYIDEDDNVSSCKAVLESLLTPLNLTFTIHRNEIWILDYSLLKNDNLSYKKYTVSGGIVASTCTNHSLTGNKIDLNSLLKIGSSFQIEAGYNNHIFEKRRYIKDIIRKVNYNDEYTDKSPEKVWELKWNSQWNIAPNQFYGTPKMHNRWVKEFESFPGWFADNQNIGSNMTQNNLGVFYANNNNRVAFYGGIKNVKVVDGVTINHTEDGNNYDNYLMVHSPFINYYNCPTETQYNIHRMQPLNLNDSKLAFKYVYNVPFINNSSSVNIRLHATVNCISQGIATNLGNWGSLAWVNPHASVFLDKFSSLVIYSRILLRRNDGSVAYFLKNIDDNEQVDPNNEKRYGWQVFNNQSFNDTYCKIYVYNVNEAGKGSSILNTPFPFSINIPANFNNIMQLEFNMYNLFYFLDHHLSHNNQPNLLPKSLFKETVYLVGYKDIYTEIVDNVTGEFIDLSNEEIEYYLDSQYKTEKEKTELLNYTHEDRFVNDIAGISVNHNGTIIYINGAQSNGFSHSNLEDLKGKKIIESYKDSQVVLTLSAISMERSILNQYHITNDMWSAKKWIVKELIHEVADDMFNLTLEEIR